MSSNQGASRAFRSRAGLEPLDEGVNEVDVENTDTDTDTEPEPALEPILNPEVGDSNEAPVDEIGDGAVLASVLADMPADISSNDQS